MEFVTLTNDDAPSTIVTLTSPDMTLDTEGRDRSFKSLKYNSSPHFKYIVRSFFVFFRTEEQPIDFYQLLSIVRFSKHCHRKSEAHFSI